jgi:hypothetical protein
MGTGAWWETHRGRLVLLAAFILAEMVLYAVIARLPRPPVSLATGLDGLVPFIPELIVIYVLKVPLVFGALLITYRKPAVFKPLALGLIAVTVLSELVFLVQPTYPPRPADLADTGLESFIAWVYETDGPANEFPSIHVSQSVFLLLFALATMASGWVVPVVGLSGMIAATTVLVKQHTVFGLLGGLLVGTLVFAAICRKYFRMPATA